MQFRRISERQLVKRVKNSRRLTASGALSTILRRLLASGYCDIIKLTLNHCTILLCLLLAGCGLDKPAGKVSGRVAFQGKPVPEATVLFTNAAQGVYITADADAEGRYAVLLAKGAGLPPGEYQVSVVPKSFRIAIPLGGSTTPAKPAGSPNIPEKYHKVETSGLKCTVVEGANRFDIDMKP